jgi:hypothetical protein
MLTAYWPIQALSAVHASHVGPLGCPELQGPSTRQSERIDQAALDGAPRVLSIGSASVGALAVSPCGMLVSAGVRGSDQLQLWNLRPWGAVELHGRHDHQTDRHGCWLGTCMRGRMLVRVKRALRDIAI